MLGHAAGAAERAFSSYGSQLGQAAAAVTGELPHPPTSAEADGPSVSVDPDRPPDPAARNAVPKNNSVQEGSASSSCMAARIASHGRRMIHSSMDAKGRTIAVPSCASHPGVLSGTLRSSTTQRPPPERAAAPWAMTSAHSGTCDRAYVDRIASISVGKSKSAASVCTSLILL